MSRWRPPAPKSSPYITPQGYATLEIELQSLWKKRRIVNDALSAAAAEGDRSENAEYIYRKKEQAEIDRRIRYLQKRMPDLKLIDTVGNQEQVFFGAVVTLETTAGEEIIYKIVGPDETHHDDGSNLSLPNRISVDSPLARALMKKQVDDEVAISIGDNKTNYIILAIHYC